MTRKIVIRATRHIHTREDSEHGGMPVVERVSLDAPPVAELSGAAAVMLRWSNVSSLAGARRPWPRSSTAPGAFSFQEAR